MTTRLELHHAVFDVLTNGGTVPCVGDPRWVSSDRTDMGEAARGCRDCPLRAMCLEYSIEADERFGVWGGKVRTWTGTSADRGLSDEEKDQIDLLVKQGLSARAIAREMGLTLGRVEHYRFPKRRPA